MKKVLVGVAAALALVTGNAAADGIVDRRAPIAASEPVVIPSWTGFYVGAGIGGGAVVHDMSLRDDIGTIASLDGIGGEGVLGTAIVGWDWQLGPKSVLGVFVDYDFSDISTDFRVPGLFGSSIDHDHSWSIGGRLGWLATPTTLLYATGGYSEARFSGFADFSDFAGLGGISDHRTFTGWFAGAGVDTRIAASNWFLRLEYRFTQYDSERFWLDDVTHLDVEPSMQSVRATLTYKFGVGTGVGWSGWGYGWGNGWGR
jgi:outer membrane immunogenic protein